MILEDDALLFNYWSLLLSSNLTRTSLDGAEIQMFQPFWHQVQVSPRGTYNYPIALSCLLPIAAVISLL